LDRQLESGAAILDREGTVSGVSQDFGDGVELRLVTVGSDDAPAIAAGRGWDVGPWTRERHAERGRKIR
jgi:hypothetical protein